MAWSYQIGPSRNWSVKCEMRSSRNSCGLNKTLLISETSIKVCFLLKRFLPPASAADLFLFFFSLSFFLSVADGVFMALSVCVSVRLALLVLNVRGKHIYVKFVDQGHRSKVKVNIVRDLWSKTYYKLFNPLSDIWSCSLAFRVGPKV